VLQCFPNLVEPEIEAVAPATRENKARPLSRNPPQNTDGLCRLFFICSDSLDRQEENVALRLLSEEADFTSLLYSGLLVSGSVYCTFSQEAFGRDGRQAVRPEK